MEVKRSADTRIRREVVGQMLDYAANAVAYWPVEMLRARFEEGHEEPEQKFIDFLGDPDTDLEDFWQKVKTNLQVGRLRLIFVADEIPSELRRIVEFLNQQMDPAEVLAVEIKQYSGQGLKTLVPRLFGQIEKHPPVSGTSEKAEAYRNFFQELIDKLREEHHFTNARIGQPQNWYSFASGFTGFSYSLSFAQGGRIRAEVYIDRSDVESNKKMFDSLIKKKAELSDKFEEELEWERLNDRRASRIAVYRNGTIEDDQQTLNDTMDWSINRLLKLREVFTPEIRELVG